MVQRHSTVLLITLGSKAPHETIDQLDQTRAFLILPSPQASRKAAGAEGDLTLISITPPPMKSFLHSYRGLEKSGGPLAGAEKSHSAGAELLPLSPP